jgi:hypothetical protein
VTEDGGKTVDPPRDDNDGYKIPEPTDADLAVIGHILGQIPDEEWDGDDILPSYDDAEVFECDRPAYKYG